MSKGNETAIGFFSLIGIFIFIYFSISFGFWAAVWGVFSVIFILAIIGISILSIIARRETEKMREELPEKVKHHAQALRRNINSSIVKNDYGKIISDRTDEVICDFL